MDEPPFPPRRPNDRWRQPGFSGNGNNPSRGGGGGGRDYRDRRDRRNRYARPPLTFNNFMPRLTNQPNRMPPPSRQQVNYRDISDNERPQKIMRILPRPPQPSPFPLRNRHPSDHPTDPPNSSNRNKKKKMKRKINNSEPGSVPWTPRLPDAPGLTIKINQTLTFEEQVNDLICQVEQTDAQRRNADMVAQDVQLMFRDVAPEAQIIKFGSSVSGLALVSSDIDIFVDFGVSDTSSINIVKEFGSMFSKSNKFSRVVKLAGARVPVIRAVHSRTGMRVDVSSSTRHGISNSLVIKFLCSVDPRVRKLFMIVLLWAKVHKICGSMLITSFTFVLLTIFYLQSERPAILPPLADILIRDCNGLTGSFKEDPRLLANSNTEPLHKLMYNFFQFYSVLKFEQVVISPYAGKLYLRNTFVDNLPQIFVEANSYEKPFDKACMTVQEPFKHSVNTARNAFIRVVESFKSGCVKAIELFDEHPKEEWLNLLFSVHARPIQIYKFQNQDITIFGKNMKDWLSKVISALKKVLKEIFVAEFQELPLGITGKIRFSGSAKQIVFNKARDNANKELEIQGSSLKGYERQLWLTQHMLKTTDNPIKFHFRLEIESLGEGKLRLNLSDLLDTRDNGFHRYGPVMMKVIPQLLKCVLDKTQGPVFQVAKGLKQVNPKTGELVKESADPAVAKETDGSSSDSCSQTGSVTSTIDPSDSGDSTASSSQSIEEKQASLLAALKCFD